MTNQTVLDYLDSRAPFATAEAWDNVGLLVGNPADPVSRILVALDVTPGAVEAAVAVGANLMVTHHPVIFSPLPQLDSHSLPYRLAKAGISVIAAHTNLDKADGGVNDTLAARLGLTDVRPADDGMCRIGTLPAAITAAAFARHVATALGTTVRITDANAAIRTVAVCGGSGGDFIEDSSCKVDALVTGEVRHHQWLAAAQRGLTVVEAGHYATEAPVADTLCGWLQDAFPHVPVTTYDDGAPYTDVAASLTR